MVFTSYSFLILIAAFGNGGFLTDGTFGVHIMGMGMGMVIGLVMAGQKG